MDKRVEAKKEALASTGQNKTAEYISKCKNKHLSSPTLQIQ